MLACVQEEKVDGTPVQEIGPSYLVVRRRRWREHLYRRQELVSLWSGGEDGGNTCTVDRNKLSCGQDEKVVGTPAQETGTNLVERRRWWREHLHWGQELVILW